LKEAVVITKIKKLFLELFPGCSYNKINISKLHGRGFPDLLIVTEYASFFIEAKAPGNKPTKLQRVKLKEIKKAGGDAVKCYWSTVKKTDTSKLLFLNPETDEVECEIDISSKRSAKRNVRVSG